MLRCRREAHLDQVDLWKPYSTLQGLIADAEYSTATFYALKTCQLTGCSFYSMFKRYEISTIAVGCGCNPQWRNTIRTGKCAPMRRDAWRSTTVSLLRWMDPGFIHCNGDQVRCLVISVQSQNWLLKVSTCRTSNRHSDFELLKYKRSKLGHILKTMPIKMLRKSWALNFYFLHWAKNSKMKELFCCYL